MNPITNMKNLNKLNDNEIRLGNVGTKTSWHNQYRESAWVFYGGMPYELTEGDIICIFSQYGEIVNVNLIRDKTTGKSKGFGFICYEDQRSTDLAVDNFNGAKILNRLIRVDHVLNYKPPKDHEDLDDITRMLREDGCSATNEALTKLSSERPVEVKQEKTRDSSRDRNRDKTGRDSDRNRDRQYRDRGDKYREADDNRDHDRTRDLERARYRDRSKERHRDRSRDKERDRSREKDKDHSRDRDKRRSGDRDRHNRHR